MLSAAPSPVVTPHPSRASSSSARSVSTATTDASCTTMVSAKVPHPHTAGASAPVGSRTRGVDETVDLSSQWFDIELTHHQQAPQAGETDASTRSPDLGPAHLAPRPPRPRPHPSWPGTMGRGSADRPLMTVRSVWQMPLADSRTSTSRGPTGSGSTSSTTSGSPG